MHIPTPSCGCCCQILSKLVITLDKPPQCFIVSATVPLMLVGSTNGRKMDVFIRPWIVFVPSRVSARAPHQATENGVPALQIFCMYWQVQHFIGCCRNTMRCCSSIVEVQCCLERGGIPAQPDPDCRNASTSCRWQGRQATGFSHAALQPQEINTPLHHSLFNSHYTWYACIALFVSCEAQCVAQ
jgi:hypothetical protein